MANKEQKKERAAAKKPNPNPAKPLPPRDATKDELDAVLGGLASSPTAGDGGGCLT